MSKFQYPPEPTGDQCNANAKLPDVNGLSAWAGWYPQMGGYTSKCVIVDESPEQPNSCFGVFVWHDGEFPFTADSENENPPAYLHHCMAEQFIRFGELVDKLKGGGPPEEDEPAPEPEERQVVMTDFATYFGELKPNDAELVVMFECLIREMSARNVLNAQVAMSFMRVVDDLKRRV